MELNEMQKNRLRESLKSVLEEYNSTNKEINVELKEYSSRIESLPKFISECDEEFEKLTSITRKDISFLIVSSALQCFRQIFTSHIKNRLTYLESAERTPFHGEEHSDRRARKYYATKEEIVNNPVPFDAIRKTDVVKNGKNPKLNGFNHRYVAIGHDPLLGLIIGTANIMTKTITVSNGMFDFDTYHVGTREATNGFGTYNVDKLTNHADTMIMFRRIYNRIRTEGKDGWEALIYSIGKELIHLLSDVRTAKSLPIPIVSAISPDISRVLNICGIDTLSTTTFGFDYFISKFIDSIIAYIHLWCYNPETDGPIETYQVRTKNIIYYSNIISMVSSTLQTVVRSYMGDASAISKFDFGGTVSGLTVIWKTPYIISDIKSEFIRNKTVNYLK